MLRMFGDTLRVLVEANETGQDTFEVLDREIGWHRLVRARADVEGRPRPPRPIRCSAPPSAIPGSAAMRLHCSMLHLPVCPDT